MGNFRSASFRSVRSGFVQHPRLESFVRSFALVLQSHSEEAAWICCSCAASVKSDEVMPSSADCVGGDAKRRRDNRAAGDSGLSVMSRAAFLPQQEALTPSPSASPPVCGGSGDVCGRLAAIHSLIEQVASEVSAVEPLIMTSEGDGRLSSVVMGNQAPVIGQEWSFVKSKIPTLSAMSSAIQTIAHHISPAPPPPPCQPDTTQQPGPPHPTTATTPPTATAADGDNGVDVTANDVWRGNINPMLSVCEAVCSARPTSKTHGTQLINEAFMLKRINGSLDSNHLTGVVDVRRSLFDYYSKSAFVLERGGELWQEMTDFIHLARNYKLIKALPLRLSAEWMADHLPTASAFDELPLALAVYKTFGHLLSYRGTSLALEQVEEEMEEQEDGEDMEDSDEEEQEDDNAMGDVDEQDEGDNDAAVQQQQEGAAGDGAGGQQGGDGGGGVARRRYTIGNVPFTTVPFTDLPPNHRYRSTYKDSDPVVRSGHYVYPTFTAFLKWMLLVRWYGQEGVGEELVTDAYVGRGDTRYRSLLTAPTIEGYKTIDCIDEHPFAPGDDGRRRLIILKGTAAADTIAAYLWLADGRIGLRTTEAPTEGNKDMERYPIAVSAARRLLDKYGLERTVLR
ncbi:unnamed protein product [Vitrella brassicaformis CCMP3155]|uniref:Uncharacterized protein n=1 Tax=Vitrella brassicaformis (strain CCMP3155) TaxID=1169540 RepID=A0A0G4E9B7_VITBC|nr:unnamed protein product [Vitrella brassicaformis CCMP3155]|eukprot:CEL92186.1 unnamed protein product [Vitrella brassicaformis CCMP3155]